MFILAQYINANIDPIKHPKLSNLTIPYPINEAGQLSPLGKDTMIRFGQRISDKYSPKSIKIYSSETRRVVESAEAFLIGLGHQNESIITVPKQIDADLNPTYACSKYTHVNNKSAEESKKWTDQYLSKLHNKIESYLGIPFTQKQILTLLEICVSQISLLGYTRSDGVCYLFTKRDFKNYELKDDVEKYFSLSYGSNFNSKISCSLTTGVIKEMKNPNFESIFRFAHAETIVPLITALGLFKDEHLSGGMSFEELENRNFFTSEFSPFQGNVIFELYECLEFQSGKCVRVLLNEKEMILPGCTIYCPFNTFVEIMGGNIVCNYDSQCKNSISTIGGWNRT